MRLRRIVMWTAALAAVACSGRTTQPTAGPGPVLVDQTCAPKACQADVVAGRAALERGDFAAAASAYECGDTREASFGAGLTTLIGAIEGSSATKVLADVGLPPFPAKDLVGPTGIFTRYAASWNGNGMIQMSDAQGMTRAIVFERGRQLAGNSAYIRMRSTTSLTSLSLQLGTATPTVGSSIQLGCQSTGYGPYLSISTENSFCTMPPVCSDAMGTIAIGAWGTTAGAKNELTFHAVKMSCRDRTGAGPETPYTLEGTLTTVISAQVDVSDLHPLFSDDEPFSAVPVTTTLEQVLADAQGLSDSIDKASCYFKTAADGATGRIFEVPGTMFGGAPIPITAADAKLFAAATTGTVGALRLAQAYSLPMQLAGLLCGGSIDCLSNEAMTERVNGGIGALRSADTVKNAESRFLDASALAAQGFGELSADSMIARTPDTATVLDRAREYVQWTHDSLAGQNPNLPHIAPPLRIDLAAPFASPPNPAEIPYKPLSYDAMTRRVTITEAFVRAAVPGWNELQWNQAFWDKYKVESLPSPDRSDMMWRRLEGYGLIGD